MIKCLTFDLDDTLWDVSPVIKNMDLKLYQWLAENAPAYAEQFDIGNFAHLRSHVVAEFPKIAHSVTSIRLKCLEIGLSRAGYSPGRARQLSIEAFAVAIVARQQVTYFPHVWQVLDQLKAQGYIMGAISNGNADIHKVGLSKHFDFQFNAHQAGVEKPDPVIFKLMLEHLQLAPEQVIHIGDNPIADVLGAQQLGMATIWVNVLPQQWLHEFQADQQISCISDLPAAVASIVAGAD